MPRSSPDRRFRSADPRRQGLRCVLWIAGIVVLIGALFVAGELAQRMVAYRQARLKPQTEVVMQLSYDIEWGPGEPLRMMIGNAYHNFPRPWEEAKLAQFKLPVYELRIAPEDRAELRRICELVQAAGYSPGIERPYVPAQFLDHGRWIDIEVKLRGWTALHYLPERPSLRLKFPKNHYFNGKRQINISDAEDKLLAQGVTTCWELARYGLLTWDSKFVVLKINGQSIGVFQEIEQFGRSMTDPALRTEGFIFSGRSQLFGASGEDDTITASDGFGWDKAAAAERRFAACRDQQSVPATQGPCNWDFVEQYLDTDKFAWAAAMTTLLGSGHAWALDNLRVYYDPARGTFEPIPWDYLSFYIDPAKSPDGETDHWHEAAFLRLPEFRRMRDQRLWTLITERLDPMIEHAHKLFAQIKEPLRYLPRNPVRVWDDADERREVENKLRANAAFLRKLYEAQDLRASGSWTAGGHFVVEVENRGKAAALVSEVVLKQQDKTIKIPLQRPHLVDGIWKGTPGRSALWVSQEAVGSVGVPKAAQLAGLTVSNAVTGERFGEREIAIDGRLEPSSPAPPAPEPLPAPKAPRNVRIAGSRIVFGPGPVRVDSTWEIPRAYSVEFRPGLRLTFAEGASLIIYGDLESIGRAGNPVTISGVNSTPNWGSLVVQGTRMNPSKVQLEYTTFSGGSGAQNARTHFTGAFAVTDGVVTVHNSRFLNLNAEDGINLRYCQVDFQNNLVSRAPDDVVDLDFCHGVAIGNLVEHGGGDGFDMSGSRMRIEQNRIHDCVDKGISVGEGTTVEIRDNLIYSCRTGIATKDGSIAKIIDTGLARVAVGLALYRKKLTFGQPSAEVEGLALADVQTALLVRPGAHLEVTSSVRYVNGSERSARTNGYGDLKVVGMPSGRQVEQVLFSNGNSEPGIRNAAQIPR
jgi:Right handed beta helix region/CotH kinase protein